MHCISRHFGYNYCTQCQPPDLRFCECGVMYNVADTWCYRGNDITLKNTQLELMPGGEIVNHQRTMDCLRELLVHEYKVYYGARWFHSPARPESYLSRGPRKGPRHASGTSAPVNNHSPDSIYSGGTYTQTNIHRFQHIGLNHHLLPYSRSHRISSPHTGKVPKRH